MGGKQNGRWKYSNEDGQLIEEGFWNNGVQNGVWLYYHDNGKLKTQGNWALGVQTGEWMYYYESGKLKEHGFWLVLQRESSLHEPMSFATVPRTADDRCAERGYASQGQFTAYTQIIIYGRFMAGSKLVKNKNPVNH